MVSCWEWPSTCYLANKLEKFTKCPAGEILKYKSNNKKKILEITPCVNIYATFERKRVR